jgi:hypothetical protein
LQHAVVDDEACKRVSCVEESKEFADLRVGHSRDAAETATVTEATKALEHSLCLLQKEVTDLRGAQVREMHQEHDPKV